MSARCEPPEGWRAVEDTRRRLLEAADFMAQERAVYVPNLLLTAARQLGQLSRTTQPVATPTELAALRAEVARLRADVHRMGNVVLAAKHIRAMAQNYKSAGRYSALVEEIEVALGSALDATLAKEAGDE